MKQNNEKRTPMKELVLFRGLPGSGKSEFATTLADALSYSPEDVVTTSADDFRMVDGKYVFDASKNREVHEKCRQRVEESMSRKFPADMIFVHNTFTQDWEMEPYFLLAETYGYKVRTVIVENRHGSENVHDVPPEHIKRMGDRFSIHLAPNPGLHWDEERICQEITREL